MKHKLRNILGASAVAVVLAALAFSSVSAAEKKKSEATTGMPACNSMPLEAACTLRNDCSWVAAVVDAKTKKEKRKAYCRAKPKTPAKKKT